MNLNFAPVALLASFWLVLAGPVPAYAQEDEIGTAETTDETYDDTYDELGYDDEAGYDDEWGYDASEFSAFESDDVVEDDYGWYDPDFAWETTDEDWDAWYEDDTEVWEDDADEDGFWDW